MKKIYFILAGIAIVSTVVVFLLTRNNIQEMPEQTDTERKEPIVLDVDNDSGREESPVSDIHEEPAAVSETADYKIINLSSNLSVMLMSSSKGSEYFPDDYLIGDLISFAPSSLKRVIAKIDTLLASMSLGEYPDDLFHPQTAFYLRDRLNHEIDRNNAPVQTRIGWPLTQTETQMNIPVRFTRRRASASGEIIFEKDDQNWFIIDIAVDFTELTRLDSEVIIYDDLIYN